MRLFAEYFSSLLHLIGILILAGGHLWLAVGSVKAEQFPDASGRRFLLALLPSMSTFFGLAILLLFASGMTKLLIWYEPGFIFLPLPYGWILLAKLTLYIVIVVNGIIIERRYILRVVKLEILASHTPLGPEFDGIWAALQRLARVNFILIMTVVALGETLRFAKMA